MASLRLSIRSALLVALSSCFLFISYIGVRADSATPKSLYDSHRWFELRDSVDKDGASAFYQGAVACAFNDPHRCDRKLRTVWNAAPRSDEAVEAHRILASAYFTHGKYKKALAQVDAILGVRPTDSDALSGRPVIAILAESPDQELAGRHTTCRTPR